MGGRGLEWGAAAAAAAGGMGSSKGGGLQCVCSSYQGKAGGQGQHSLGACYEQGQHSLGACQEIQ